MMKKNQQLIRVAATQLKGMNFLRMAALGSAAALSLGISPAWGGYVQTFNITLSGEITYYDNVGQIIQKTAGHGDGSFSVNMGDSICVENEYMGCNPASYNYPSLIVNNPVTAFSIEINGKEYNQLVGPTWWSDGSGPVGQGVPSRSQPFYNVGYDRWLAGDVLMGIDVLALLFASSTPSSADGTWISYGADYVASGIWTTTVPIPAALWLFGSALCSLWSVNYLRQQRR